MAKWECENCSKVHQKNPTECSNCGHTVLRQYQGNQAAKGSGFGSWKVLILLLIIITGYLLFAPELGLPIPF